MERSKARRHVKGRGHFGRSPKRKKDEDAGYRIGKDSPT